MNAGTLNDFGRILAGLLLILGIALAGLTRALAAPVPVDPAAGGPRIIVRFDKASLAAPHVKGLALSESARAQRLGDALVSGIGMSSAVSLRHERRLAVGADRFIVQAASPVDLARVLERLREQPGVVYAVEDRWMHPNFVPNDPRYAEQWHYFERAGGIDLPGAWDVGTGDGVVVAVIDTGYRPHEDLADAILPGYDFISDRSISRDRDGRDADARDQGDWGNDGLFVPSSWHGTHVSGTIAARTNNGIGVAGVAFNAKILPVRVLGAGGGLTSDVVDGMVWAAGGAVPDAPANATPAKVLNLSLGGGGACSPAEQDAVNTARSLGATVVVAGGNGNSDPELQSPANCEGVVVVAATDRSGHRAPYSNVGQRIDIAAPGGDTSNSLSGGVLSTVNAGLRRPGGDTYDYYQGTSMATPHVTGVAALMASLEPALTPDEIECTLKATARAFPDPSQCPNCGAGIVDARNAVLAVKRHHVSEECGVTPVSRKIALRHPVPLEGLRADQLRFFVARVPANRLVTVTTQGGPGDLDLLVSAGDMPTLGESQCVSANVGNSETCTVATAGTGFTKVNILVYGYRDFRDASLVVRTAEIPTIEAGTPVPDLSGGPGSLRLFHYTAPPAGGTLDVQLSGGTGDADLVILVNDPNGGPFVVCDSEKIGNNENCSFDLVGGALYDIEVSGFDAYAGATLLATYTPPVFLENGKPRVIAGSAGSVKVFKFQVPEGSTNLHVTTAGGSGDADLHMVFDGPDGRIPICDSTTGTSDEVCDVDDPGAGLYSIQVAGFTNYSGVTLTATATP